MLRICHATAAAVALVSAGLVQLGPALAEDAQKTAAAPVVATAAPAESELMTTSPTTAPVAAQPITIEPDPTLPSSPTNDVAPKAITIEPDPNAPDAAAASAEPEGPPPPTLTASIDLAAQRMTVMENGEFLYSWAISSGTRRYATPTGVFRAQWKARMWHSRQWGWAPMPHAVFIHRGVAVHATGATGMLGRPASHGCIRLSPANAKTFYKLVDKHGLKLTEVRVHGTPNWREPAVASRRKKRAPAVASSGSWFWDAPAQPAVKKKKPKLYAYRKKGTNQIVYFAQPPSSMGSW